MGFKLLELRMPTNFMGDDLRNQISATLGIRHFTFQIESQSLDARKRSDICWLVRVGISSDELPAPDAPPRETTLAIPFAKRNKRVIVVGAGPAGFFAGYVLQKAGFDVTIIERGMEVRERGAAISHFESTGTFSSEGNYAFGEGGAGTFSDGKLTSRSKHISAERQFILQAYIDAGAPPEIARLAHPHIGSDNLRVVVQNLRGQFINAGGQVLFRTRVADLIADGKSVNGVITGNEELISDYTLFAPGHSAYDTYRMLMKRGIPFRTKNFAIGCRAEHHQEIINLAQWGRSSLAGVKAAEYRLAAETDKKQPVYTFCMCPGGIVVPATACEGSNIVNGMSLYQRNGRFANAACVAGIHPNQLAGKDVSPQDALKHLEELEKSFYNFTNSYKAPACSVQSFINRKYSDRHTADSSYPLGLVWAELWELLPTVVSGAIRYGLIDFCRKIKGYNTGMLIGLESKTSSPIQVLRNREGLVEGFDNLYVAGEGSGYAGGIISSAADGVKAAMNIIARCP